MRKQLRLQGVGCEISAQLSLSAGAADALVYQAALEQGANQNTSASTAIENEAFATFDSLLKDKVVRDSAARAFDLIHFKYGEALMTAANSIVLPKSIYRR